MEKQYVRIQTNYGDDLLIDLNKVNAMTTTADGIIFDCDEDKKYILKCSTRDEAREIYENLIEYNFQPSFIIVPAKRDK